MLRRFGDLNGPISVRASSLEVGSIPEASDRELDVARLLNAVWRGKGFILGIAFLAFVASGIYAYRIATPVYSATAQLVLDGRQQTVTDLDSVVSGLSTDQITINTELEVMRSRRLVGLLVDRMDLTNAPEYNPWLSAAPARFGWQSIKDGVKSLLFGSPTRARPLADHDRLRDIVVSAVRARISTGNLNRTSVFTIRASSTNQDRVAGLANNLAELYVLDQLETKFRGTQQATEWLSRRVSDLRAELEADEAAIKALNAASDLVSVRDLEARNRQIKGLRDRFDALQLTLVEATARQGQLEEAVGDPDAMVRVGADPVMNQILADGGAGADVRLNAHFDRILSRARLDVERAEAQADAIASTLNEIEVSVAEQSLDLVELQHLQREADASRAIYEYFLARLKETSIQEGTQRADSRILSLASRPNFPTERRKKRLVINATMLAALMAGALVVITELLQKGIRSAEDLELETGYPVVGQVPLIPGSTPKQKLQNLIDKPNSAPAEAVRNMRTSVLTPNSSPQIIMVTSSVPDEGKTTQAIALAQNIAVMGRRVLLIEGDIRRPAFRDTFGANSGLSLTSVLAGSATLASAIFHDPATGLAILAGDTGQTNAADMFSSDEFSRLIETARDTFDVVLIDTPPVLVVPDARIIAPMADTLLYVVRWNKTSVAQVLEGLRQLETGDQRVDGLILAQVNPKRMRALWLGQSNGAYATFGQAYYER